MNNINIIIIIININMHIIIIIITIVILIINTARLCFLRLFILIENYVANINNCNIIIVSRYCYYY